jgi:hypothetical protein
VTHNLRQKETTSLADVLIGGGATGGGGVEGVEGVEGVGVLVVEVKDVDEGELGVTTIIC